jgi:asparagine synthase (glutamine-hydrolysing)
MCGIAGIIRFAGLTQQDRHCATRLSKLLAHRGPDASGIHASPTCTLVQTRLALTGPNIELPLTQGRHTLVYNGEIYRFTNDTEAVLHALIADGPRALPNLNGMFALFLWDAREQRGFAAVDPLSIKPFFYAATPERFAFASEAGALIESGAVPFKPNPEAIAESLTAPYFSGAHDLPFANIQRLLPGHSLELTRDGITTHRYFDFTHSRDAARPYPEDLPDTLHAAITHSLRSDAPVGTFLSGGVDSSLIAAIAQKPAWTISYENEDRADYAASLIVKSPDRPYAERVAARHGLDHRIVHVTPTCYEAALQRTLHANDLICAWEQEVSQQLLAEAAAPHVKAVLVGDAADETHFGYSFLLNPQRIATPHHILEFFGAVPLRREFLDNPIEHFGSKYQAFAKDRGYSWASQTDQRLAMSCLIYHLWLTRLLHNGDIHLMHHSLEGRVPFGDARLLALAQTIPQELGYRDGIEKWHLRKGAERFLDAEIAWRPKSALTKNLHAHAIVHRHFQAAWKRSGDFLTPYVDADRIHQLGATERDTGLYFRLLSVLTWFERFSSLQQV